MNIFKIPWKIRNYLAVQTNRTGTTSNQTQRSGSEPRQTSRVKFFNQGIHGPFVGLRTDQQRTRFSP